MEQTIINALMQETETMRANRTRVQAEFNGVAPYTERELLASMLWRRSEAISLCRKIESVIPPFGCHVALTGGLLYKDGDRKDCDLLFYRIRQVKEINMDGLWRALEGIRFYKTSGFDWCYKALYKNKPVDCFFPEGGNSGESNSPTTATIRRFQLNENTEPDF